MRNIFFPHYLSGEPLSVQISNFNKASKTKRGQHAVSNLLTSCGRDYWTRTSDPYVPNVVRYQLR